MGGWPTPVHGVGQPRRWFSRITLLTVAGLTAGLLAAAVAVATAVGDVDRGSDRPLDPAVAPAVALPREHRSGTAVVQDGPLFSVPRGEPTRVLVPAIEVDVALVRLGLRSDRAMEVPAFGLAGWYAKGPKPGHPGPAVLAGHVDSRVGPDVFFRLRELVADDLIHVIYDSGDRVTFVVTSSETTPKTVLPVESIWPVTNDRLLTMITCGGTFDRSARSYEDNVIVYAVPLDPLASEVR